MGKLMLIFKLLFSHGGKMGVIQPTLQGRWKIKQEKTQPLIVSQVRKELGKRLFLHSSASVSHQSSRAG